MARCTVERLMRELGTTGAVRGKKVITMAPDPTAPRAPDLVDRGLVADAPNRCWVADFTHVATWTGVVYVAFVVDTFSRRIVGWSAATTKETGSSWTRWRWPCGNATATNAPTFEAS
ncbi:putative transposase [Streptomyces sp. DI166]|nr:putative transposase [Streptomyces sp. DI166]